MATSSGGEQLVAVTRIDLVATPGSPATYTVPRGTICQDKPS